MHPRESYIQDKPNYELLCSLRLILKCEECVLDSNGEYVDISSGKKNDSFISKKDK